ncbi:MAG TPA: UvrD-helicase domain-containing protein [Cyclobacteriaceae bacterium]|nr:UvrD-helicase domain-containing protein [Cyclobacteriaceae bacterium]
MTKTFHIYRSSAGSGKTRTLAKRYILLALSKQPEYFRFILAVTFANKATQEMKSRILEYLDDFANGRPNNLSGEIKTELHIDDDTLQAKSREVLSYILHKYSQFSISTIDAFFQRVIRSFTREAGLMGNFRLEVDTDYVLDEVIAALMDDLGPERQDLTDWVVQFSRERLQEGENWNVEFQLKMFAKEIFKEQFKTVEDRILGSENILEDNRRMLDFLQTEVNTYRNYMRTKASEALRILDENNIKVSDFSYGDIGTIYAWFRDLSLGKSRSRDSKRIEASVLGPTDWFKKGIYREKYLAIAESKIMPIVRDMVAYDDENSIISRTAIQVLKNFYAFGLITDITRKLRDYREENNLLILADASKFLNGVINNSDTPFVYEKVGSYYRNYLIDEFQDTSLFQWKNFTPLLREAGDQNYFSLIVGDVKQSIYRWRSGDLEILQKHVVNEFGEVRTEIVPLDTNFRSAGNIVDFNNTMFKAAAARVATHVNDNLPVEVFAEAEQKKSKWLDSGFVRMKFFERNEEDEGWEEQAMRMIPTWMEQLQDKGAKQKEIAIIVRKNEEGQRIAQYLLNFRNTPEAKPGYSYEVVSNESLRLDTSLSVNIIISALKFLKNTQDRVSRGQLAYELAGTPADDLFIKAGSKDRFEDTLPPKFLDRLKHFKQLSLFELTEEIIQLFGLGEKPEELAYLQAFQDLILEFSARERTDINSFLEWWEMYKARKSIKVSSSIDAANIVTIHGSKGLQYKYVIIPFCNWRFGHESSTPLMWITPTEKPFNQLGALALRFSTDLKRTQFEAAYQEEYVKVYLDNLNLLYVAFTRAEWGLIVTGPVSNSGRMNFVGEVVQAVLQEKYPFQFNGVEFSVGEINTMPDQWVKTDIIERKLDRYPSTDWREKLVIKREGSEFFEDEVSEKRSKINRGILIHTVLSRIEYKTDAEEKLIQFFLEHALPNEDIEAVRKDVYSVLDHPVMSNWFTKEWEIKAEALVLLPGGTQKRIDRIMLGKKRTVIVDYKTGERKSADRDQIEVYARVLTQMGYPNVQAFLVYLKDMKLDEVISNSTFNLFG